MRDTLRTLRLMIAISWQADAARSLAAVFTASGQYVVLPVRAVGLRLIVDGVVDARRSVALAGAAVIVGVGAVNRLLAWASLNVRMRLREHTQLYLDTHLMALTAGLPGVAHHELPEYLDSVERLRNERPYLANPFNPLSWTLASTLQVTLVVALFADVSPLLALLPAVAVPAAVATGRAEQRGIALVDSQAEDQRVLGHLLHLGIDPAPAKEVRIYDLGDELLQRRRSLFGRLEAARVAQSAGNVVRIGLGWALFAVAYGVGLVWTVRAVDDGRMTIGAVVLVLTLGTQLNTQLAELAYHVAWLSRSFRAVRRLVWFSDYAETARAAFTTPLAKAPPDRLHDGIRLENVSFIYPGAHRPVLDRLDLHLPAGATVAVVGENGSGKTTLVKLLARLYDPTGGRILVEGVDLRAFEVERWRQHLSAGFQDFVRLELLVRDSVGAGDVSDVAPDYRIETAFDRAVASGLLAELPDHLDTQLGRAFDGIDLSLGQWQKVALARAMLREQPLLLLLDEPTASLDAPTEHALFERFAAAAKEAASRVGGITVLISHRFSTVRMADLIVVLDDGQIVERGSHDELVGRGGLYAELYRLQARAYRVQ